MGYGDEGREGGLQRTAISEMGGSGAARKSEGAGGGGEVEVGRGLWGGGGG